MLALLLLIFNNISSPAHACVGPGTIARYEKEIQWQSDHIGRERILQQEAARLHAEAARLYQAKVEHSSDQRQNLTELENTILGLDVVAKEGAQLLNIIAENEAYRKEIAAQLSPERMTDENPLQQAIERIRLMNLPPEILLKLETAFSGFVELEKRQSDLANSNLELLLTALTIDDAKAGSTLFNQVIVRLNRIKSRCEIQRQKISDTIRKVGGESEMIKSDLDAKAAKLAAITAGIERRLVIYRANVQARDNAPICMGGSIERDLPR